MIIYINTEKIKQLSITKCIEPTRDFTEPIGLFTFEILSLFS